MSLVAIQGSVGLQLVSENPLAGHKIGIGWTRDQIPSVVGAKGIEIVLHSSLPIFIIESCMVSFGNGRKRGNREVETLNRLTKTVFVARRHGVVIDDGVNRLSGGRWGWWWC